MTLLRAFVSRFLLFFVVLGTVLSLVSANAFAGGRPTFRHRTPTSVSTGKSLRISGKILNMEDLDYAEFRFRKMGTKDPFRALKMKQEDETFYVIIPKKYIKTPGMEYYVVGIDFNSKPHLLAGSPALPKQFLIVGGEDEVSSQEKTIKKDEDEENSDDSSSSSTFNPPKKGGQYDKGETLSRKLVVSADSREELPLQWSPLTASVITAQDIENYGWRTILSILRFAVGIDINDNGYRADIGLRGVNSPHSFGNRIKFLLDGHDMAFRQRAQSYLNSSWLSVDSIERIEIIRAPVAGLWGSGAHSATIQIISKSGATMKGTSATMGWGALSNSHFFEVRGGYQFKSGLTFYSTFSLYKDIRSPILSPVYEFLHTESDELTYILPNSQSQSRNFYVKMGWKGLQLSLHHSFYDANAPINRYGGLGSDDTRIVNDRLIARLSWEAKLSKTAQLKLWASFDRFRIAPNSAIEMNPLSPHTSTTEQEGASSIYMLSESLTGKKKFMGYFPACSAVSTTKGAPSTKCVTEAVIQYEDKGKKQKVAACLLQAKPGEKVKAQQDIADRYKTWFPMSHCQKTFTNGRHLQPISGGDDRIQAGLNLRLALSKEFTLTWGLDLEFLMANLWHFDLEWQRRLERYKFETETPDYTNFRIGSYLQARYVMKKFMAITAAARIDYDQLFGVHFSPQASAVFAFTPTIFAKLHYGWGFQAPALYDYYHVERNRYGNVLLRPEEVHTVGLQAGWWNKKLMMLSVSAYGSFYNSAIKYTTKKSKKDFEEDPDNEVPYDFKKPEGTYQQLTNDELGFSSLGGEVELRLFPFKGIELLANFGIALATRTLENGDKERLFYSAGLYGSLSASYRHKMGKESAFLASLGLLYTGTKLVGGASYQREDYLPATDVGKDKAQKAPHWSMNKDPRIPAERPELGPISPGYMKLHVTLQFLKLFGHLDWAIRAQNILGAFSDSYDASDPFLYPQTKFELLTWVKLHY